MLGDRYGIDPRLAEVVRAESDEIVGGIPGHLLCMKGGTLLPNAGVDASDAPPGFVVLLPKDPDRSARTIREEIRSLTGARVGVIIADSVPMPCGRAAAESRSGVRASLPLSMSGDTGISSAGLSK